LSFVYDANIQKRNAKILLAPAFAKAMAGTANIFAIQGQTREVSLVNPSLALKR